MVVSWLLNSIDPSLSSAFIYANSAKELWNELVERFGQSNGPLLYKVQKEVEDLSEIPLCGCDKSCEAIKKTIELAQR